MESVVKFIANYIKGCNVHTIYRNFTSIQRQFKTGIPQGAVLSLTLFIIYTAVLPHKKTLKKEISKSKSGI